MSYYKILLVTIALISLSPLLIPRPDKLEYRESDFFDYYFYTDVDIKQAPRISTNYFSNIFLLREVLGKQILLFFTVVMQKLFVII